MHKVLITGSTGYIGSHFAEYCRHSCGWEPITVDRAGGFDFTASGWTERLPDRPIDLVVHLAQSRMYRDFPVGARDMFLVNVASTVELLEWSRLHGVKRFVFTSSGTVYGSSPGLLVEDAPCDPATMYAATKLAAEYMIRPYAEFLEIVSARLFSVYGPNQQGTLIANMIERVSTGQEIVLAGKVGIYLTPIFIGDCVKVLARLATAPIEGHETLVNVAGDESISLAEIVTRIAARLGKRAAVRMTADEPRYLRGDCSQLKKVYAEPFVSFDDGLDVTVAAALAQEVERTR